MSRFVNRKSIISVLVALTLVAAFAGGVFLRGSGMRAHASGGTRLGAGNNNPICGRLGKSLQGSQGMQMWCFGPQTSSKSVHQSTSISFIGNVDAANPNEDRNPAGVQAYGQSEESIAASGPYVVEAWNDSTGFLSPPCSPMNKDQLTGFAFSNNGGSSFKDLGGLPNSNCLTSATEGDPSVEVYTVGGKTYFYISSIFIPFNVPEDALSVTACVVNGSGSSATLSCSDPIVAAISSQCGSFDGFTFCSFLDKEFLSIDPARGRLYMSYTEFGINSFPPDTLTNGQIELAVCDLSTPAAPVCHNGSDGSITGPGALAAPYLVVAPGDLSCEREGAYPAVDPATGDVYVAHEFNWATNLFGSFGGGPVDCRGVPTKNQMNRVPLSCLTLTPTSPCTTLPNPASVRVISMDGNFIPGYNRFPGSDFPRVAVSDRNGTVSMVWNDARQHPMGDIFLQSFTLGSGLHRIQNSPVRINSDATGGLHFLPALRYPDGNGNLPISWYVRANANTALTDVDAVDISPLATGPANSTVLITTGPSDWNAVSSIIIPNFGDYTDNFVVPGSNGSKLYVAWADGRVGPTQPFEAHINTNKL